LVSGDSDHTEAGDFPVGECSQAVTECGRRPHIVRVQMRVQRRINRRERHQLGNTENPAIDLREKAAHESPIVASSAAPTCRSELGDLLFEFVDPLDEAGELRVVRHD
jgi:hypothetical protein